MEYFYFFVERNICDCFKEKWLTEELVIVFKILNFIGGKNF